MKQLFTFIVLLCHINFMMFFPTMEEHNVYAANGVMVDEINSVCEFVSQSVLGEKDDTPEDEDDDEPDFYQVKGGDFYFHTVASEIKSLNIPVSSNVYYPGLAQKKLIPLFYDIIVPPPEA
jgi:hypothetical protein